MPQLSDDHSLANTLNLTNEVFIGYHQYMLKKYLALPLAISLLAATSSFAFAQNVTTTSTPTTETVKPGKAMRQQVRQTFKSQKQALLDTGKANREQFKAQLAAIKDAKKKQILSLLDTKIAAVNKRRTTHMTNALTRLQQILDKITERAATAKTQGMNTTAVDQAVATAETAMTTAQTAVTTQTGKDYVISVPDETRAKAAVGQTIDSLHTDLRTTRQSVLAAKQAVLGAAIALAKLTPLTTVEPSLTATPEATITSPEQP